MSDTPGAKKFNLYKLAVAAVAVPYACWYATDTKVWHYIDGVDLLIHEGGHFVFLPFGDVLHIAGGSIMQCLIPALFVIHFCRCRDFFSASIMGFWLGFNFINVSIYAADAIKMELPILGGDDVIHDWNWLIVHFNALYYTYQVSGTIYALGVFILVLSSFFSIMCARETQAEAEPAGDLASASQTIPLSAWATAHEIATGKVPLPAENQVAIITPMATQIPVAAIPARSQVVDRIAPIWSRVESLSVGLISPAKMKMLAGVGVAGLGLLFAYNHGWLETFNSPTGWPNDFPKAVAQAKIDHRPILVSFTGSDWCGACMQLDSTVFDTKTFRDYAAQHVEFVQIDIPHYKILSPGLKKQNYALQERFEVSAFPTVVVLSSKGNELDEIVGCPPGGPGEYIQAIESILKKYPKG